MAKGKEIVKKENTEIAALPQLSEEDRQAMYGDFGREHVTIPRIGVLETLSPEVGDNLGKSGDLFVKGINKNLGSGPIEIVVLMRNCIRIKWKPLNEGGGLECNAMDGRTGVGNPGGECAKCPLKEWKGKEKPKCDLYENFVIVIREELKSGEAFPMALSGSRSKLKGLKDFNTMLMQLVQKGRPLFAKSFMLKIVEKINPKIPGNNKYHVFQLSPGNNNSVLPDAEQVEAYKLFKAFAGATIEMEMPSQQEEIKDNETAF